MSLGFFFSLSVMKTDLPLYADHQFLAVFITNSNLLALICCQLFHIIVFPGNSMVAFVTKEIPNWQL